jgi:hypothetical protein
MYFERSNVLLIEPRILLCRIVDSTEYVVARFYRFLIVPIFFDSLLSLTRFIL